MRVVMIIGIVLMLIISCNESNHHKTKTHMKEISNDTLEEMLQRDRYKSFVDSIQSSLKSIERDIYESAEGGTVACYYHQSDT